jgi:oxygen-independent coproporphyrinogen-3 oxidase
MEPYEVFPKRISHHAVAEQLKEATLTYPEIQQKMKEFVQHGHDRYGNRVGYIHHPFCEKLCKFCAFYKVLKDEDALARFLDVLNESIRKYGDYDYVRSTPFDAFYFGGGTPTTMTPEQMKRLLQTIKESFTFDHNLEFTSESSFANIKYEMLTALKEGGVNRMSLGVQTFSPRLRKVIGRQCPPDGVIEKIGMVRKFMGIVNIDLVYNLPSQTLEEWDYDLNTAVKTNTETISVHPLVPVKDSPLSKMITSGEVEPMGDEKKQYEYYSMALDTLCQNGYHQVNFCFFTRSSNERLLYFRHRLQEGDCISFGPGAVGNMGDFVYFNMPNVEYYNQIVEAGEFPSIAGGFFKESFKVAWAISEEILFGKEVDKKRLSEKYGVDINEQYKNVLGFLAEQNLIEDRRDSFTVTPSGLFWAHNIGELFQNSPEND